MSRSINTAPAPAGFREFALTHAVHAVRVEYQIGHQQFHRWCAEVGIAEAIAVRKAEAAVKAMPAGFADHAHEHIDVLRERYGAGKEKVYQWRRELGVKVQRPLPAIPARPVPTDFADRARTMIRAELQAHYKAANSVVDRWLREAGVSARRHTHQKRGMIKPVSPTSDGSLASQAARHLQSLRIIPVVRASIIDPRRDGYVVGSRSMSTDDMISFATAKGFDPAAWSRLTQGPAA